VAEKLIPYRRDDSRWEVKGYTVTVAGPGWSDLECSCIAGRNHRICKHAAVVAKARAAGGGGMSGKDATTTPAPDPDEVVTLAEASALAGLAHITLAIQVRRGRLDARKSGGTWVLTRRNLHEYLASRREGNAVPVSAGYVTPRGMKPLRATAATTTDQAGEGGDR
jgi:hypothetical protein